MKNKTKILRIIQFTIVCHILMSTDCGGFPRDNANIQESKTKIFMDNTSNFNVNDTIWVTGFRSMKNYDISNNDSIIQNFTPYTNLDISKLVINSNYNLTRATNKFEFIALQMPSEDFCENRSIRVKSTTDNTNNLFRYKIGIIPKASGDFVISFDNRFLLQNIDKRQDILSNYPINDPFKMVWEVCNQTIPRRDLTSSDIFIKIN